MPKEQAKSPAKKTAKKTAKKVTVVDEIQSLKVRVFEAEKQIDALNTALTVVSIASGAQKKRLDKITSKQYENYVFNTLHPMISKGNEFVHEILVQRGLIDDSEK